MESVFRLGVYGIALRKQCILLVRKKSGPYEGLWDLPGGKVEFGEGPEETLRREFLEETGCSFSHLLWHANLSHTISNQFHHFGLIYTIEGVSEQAEGSDEANWFPIDSLKLSSLTPFAKEAVLKKPTILDRFRIVDLTHPLHEGVPTWSGGCGFRLEIKLDYEKGLRVQSVKSHAGVGTHMDAPSHFIPGAKNIDEIPLDKLIVPACILDLREEMDPDLLVLPRHIEAYERKFGAIRENSLVIANTGWEQYWKQPDRYRNPDAAGKMHFPGFSAQAAELLVEKHAAGIGIDTLSPDGSNEGFPVHEKILGAGKYIIENLANLSTMPPAGAYAIAFPPRAQGATESAARIAGLIPQ